MSCGLYEPCAGLSYAWTFHPTVLALQQQLRRKAVNFPTFSPEASSNIL